MLSERKNKTKYSLNPNGADWANGRAVLKELILMNYFHKFQSSKISAPKK